MIQQMITLQNQLGLHARAAAKVVQLANKFESEIMLECSSKKANAKSIMGVMMLAGSHKTPLLISAHGSDEKDAIIAMVALIQNKFGEQA